MANLTLEQIERIKAYKVLLGVVDPSTLERAISDFELDEDPDVEIGIWEGIAMEYEASATDDMNVDEKKELFKEVLRRSFYSDPIQIYVERPDPELN